MDSIALEPDKRPVDSIKNGSASTAADCFTQRRARHTGAKLPLDLVKMPDLPEYPSSTLFGFALEKSFVELPSRMRPAGGQLDAFALAGVGAISSVGIALDGSGEVHGGDVMEAFMASPGMPVIKEISSGAMAGPKISLRGLAGPRGKIFDQCFIDLHVAVRCY